VRAKEEAFRILESALSLASAGVDDAEVGLGGGDLGVTRFADNQIHPSSEHNIETISIRISAKKKVAMVETTDLSTTGIKDAAQQARARAEHMPDVASVAGFPEPQSYEFVEAYDPETEATKSIDRAALVSRSITSALRHGLSASGLSMVRRGVLGLDGQGGVYAVANTRGLLAYHPETRIRYSVAMSRKTGASGWAEDESFTACAVDVESLVAVATNKALVGAEPRRIEPGRYAAVLEPHAVGALLRFVGLTAGASAMHTGRSFLSGRIGKPVAGRNVTISDDHAHPLHRGIPFDVEGVAKQRVEIVKGGVALGCVYSWDSAVRHEGRATGHRVRHAFDGPGEAAEHLVMDGGDATLSDMIGQLDSGVVIGRLGSIQMLEAGTLLVTGVTRGGVFLVRKGELVSPLQNMRFSVSILDLFSKIEALGSPVWTRGGVVPPIRVSELNLIAGTSL
jgi:predicted Zn-dependent protease